ncbi:MAG: gliding motility protein GldN [Dysgonomonas sp.]|jgi:gliding motility associated protien GldN|nr:gliding motility protein GldN [Prevotella sp.]
MKYIVSLMLGGLLITSSLMAQNSANNGYRMMNGAPITSTTEDMVTEISSRELFLVEKSMNDYSSSTWTRDIYREIYDVEGNESLFYPTVSTEKRANLFSLIINLLSDNTIQAYKFEDQPDFNDDSALTTKEVMDQNKIGYTETNNRTLSIKREDLANIQVIGYLVKEKWYYDIKTGKGDVRVEALCPVICDRGRQFPAFWVMFDDISVYAARAISPVAVANISPVLSNASIFDIFRNRYYRGCIYRVGMRDLGKYFTTPESLAKERQRIESELDFVQSRFDAIATAHHEN